MARNRNTKKAPQRCVNKFHMEYLNAEQKMAWAALEQHDVVFLAGPAGVGKSHLAMAFAIHEVLSRNKNRIVLTRPIVESGERLGFLPGDMYEKVDPYMKPLYDCLRRIVGMEGPQRERIEKSIEIEPLAYMRGRTFDDAVCIFDEAQNASKKQLKMFLTRFGENSTTILTGDPKQTDLEGGDTGAFVDCMNRLQTIPGIAIHHFTSAGIVRHPLIAKIIEKLEE